MIWKMLGQGNVIWLSLSCIITVNKKMVDSAMDPRWGGGIVDICPVALSLIRFICPVCFHCNEVVDE